MDREGAQRAMAVLDEQEDQALAAQAVATIAMRRVEPEPVPPPPRHGHEQQKRRPRVEAAPYRISRRDERRHPVSDRARAPARTHPDGTSSSNTRGAAAAPDNTTDEALSQGLHDG